MRLGRTHTWVARAASGVSVLAVALAAAGCGGSATHSSPSPQATAAAQQQNTPAPATPAQEVPGAPPHHASSHPERLPPVTLEVSIPGLSGPERVIPARYTCDGANTSLPVQWKGIPRGTAELALFLASLHPVNGSLFFDWAVAGLSPTSHGIPAGTLPSGVVVARNNFGRASYSLCPAKGSHEIYVMRLVALPHRLAVKPGVDAQVLFRDAERSAKAVGIAGGDYTRP